MRSEIIERIQEYRRGATTLQEVTAWLRKRRYTQSESGQRAARSGAGVELLDPPGYASNSWDEVVRARNLGLLTADEYFTIADEVWHGSRAHDRRLLAQAWVLGALKRTAGTWQWKQAPIPTYATARIETAGSLPAPVLELEGAGGGLLHIGLGSDFAHGTAVLQKLQANRQDYDTVAQVPLDDQGAGDLRFPTADRAFRVVIIPAAGPG
jgi:hypothetical protein